MKLTTRLYMLLFAGLLFGPVHAQISLDFNSPNDLLNNFAGDDSPTLSYAPTAGLGGSGALFEGADDPELWVMHPDQGVGLIPGTYTLSAYFKLNTTGNGSYIGLGLSTFGAGLGPNNGGTPGGMGGNLRLDGNQIRPGSSNQFPGGTQVNGSPLTAGVTVGNWYQMVVTIQYIAGDQFNITTEVFNSDANGVVGSLIAAFDYASSFGNNMTSSQMPQYARYMPYFAFGSTNNSSNPPGFRTLDNFSFNGPSSTLPLAVCTPISGTFSSAGDIVSQFTSDGNPSVSFASSSGLGGSGAIVENGNSPNSEAWTSKRALPMNNGPVSTSGYFKLDAACSSCYASIGLGAFSQNFGNINNATAPDIEFGVYGDGGTFLLSSTISSTQGLGRTSSLSPLVAGNWYYLQLEVVKLGGQALQVTSQLMASDANGILGNSLAQFTDTISGNTTMAAITDAYPFFYVLNDNPTEDFGFRTIDNFGASCTNTPVAAVPTLSQWGLILLALTMMCIGAIYLHNLQDKTTRSVT